MKKLLVTLASIGFAAGVPHAAYAMDCCQDGKCSCCKKEDEAPKPAPQAPHQH